MSCCLTSIHRSIYGRAIIGIRRRKARERRRLEQSLAALPPQLLRSISPT